MSNATNEWSQSTLRWPAERPFATALAGSGLLWISFAPCQWWPVAWLAIIPWISLITVKQFEAQKPWRKIWLAGFLYWLATLYFIPIPHPVLWAGWIVLALVLSIYPLLFVWLGRVMVHTCRIPFVWAAPISFTGMEWLRAHLFTGFGPITLANSQYHAVPLIQICDVCGAYGLSFLMVLFAALLWRATDEESLPQKGRFLSFATVVLCVPAVYFYFSYDGESDVNQQDISGTIVMVQGSIDTRFPTNEQEANDYETQLFEDYARIQQNWWSQLSRDSQPPMLVIWPEGKYPVAHVIGQVEGELKQVQDYFPRFHQEYLYGYETDRKRIPLMLVGGARYEAASEASYNSVFLLNQDGQVAECYDKQHLVLIGEYFPFSQSISWLRELPVIGRGLVAGAKPVAFQLPGDWVAAPTICFESTIAHLVRNSVNQLAAAGNEPDFLVNLTDDGWFYGTAALEHHLAANVMRAVENRKPMLVAANTGLSASIDRYGRIIQQGPRRQEAVLDQIQITRSDHKSFYRIVGDWPAFGCFMACLVAAGFYGWNRFQGAPDYASGSESTPLRIFPE